MKPNWFIAFPFTAELSLPAPPPRTRLFTPEDRHLTAAFLGGVTEAEARRAWSLVAQIPLEAPSVALGELRLLGGRRPTAVAAIPSAGFQPSAQVMVRVQSPLIEAGLLARDRRPPLPHVTVARIHRKASRGERGAVEAWMEALVLETEGRLTELALYTWVEDRRERLFRVVERRPLNE